MPLASIHGYTVGGHSSASVISTHPARINTGPRLAYSHHAQQHRLQQTSVYAVKVFPAPPVGAHLFYCPTHLRPRTFPAQPLLPLFAAPLLLLATFVQETSAKITKNPPKLFGGGCANCFGLRMASVPPGDSSLGRYLAAEPNPATNRSDACQTQVDPQIPSEQHRETSLSAECCVMRPPRQYISLSGRLI